MKTRSLTSTCISLITAGLLLLTSCATVSDEPAADLALPSPTEEKMAAIEEEVSSQPGFAEALECPKSPIPERQLSLVNLSDYPDDEIINCFNFAVNKIAEMQTDVMMIMYPVGPFLSGEVKDNDTDYRGAGFEPVVTADQRDSMASSLESYLEPACGGEFATYQARQVSRFAELGGGQQVAGAGGGSDECGKKRWMILSIDPDRAGPSRELVTTFFHEVFHTVQASPSQPCNYSGAPAVDDQFWIHEAGATFFGFEMAAELGNLDSSLGVVGSHGYYFRFAGEPRSWL